VPQLAGRRQAPGEEDAVRVERGAVARAAAHDLNRRGIRKAGARQGDGGRRGGVVVSTLAELPVEPAPEGVQRAASG
jgi:hypothetical protein